MNNKIIIGVIAAAVVGAGLVFLLMGDDDTAPESNTEQNQQTSEQQSAEEASFVPTEGLAFTAAITTTEPDGTVTTGELKYNGENSWSWSGETEAGASEARVVDGVLYTYDADNDQWLSLGTGGGSTSAINPAQYNYDMTELNAFRSQAEYLGQQPCPAGSCETWQANDYDGNDTFTIGFDSNNRISRVSGVSEDGTEVQMDYMYGEVDVQAPANAQTFEIPNTP